METQMKIVELDSFVPVVDTDEGTIYGPTQYQATIELGPEIYKTVDLDQSSFHLLSQIAIGEG